MVLTLSAFLSLALVGFFHTILGAALPAIRLSLGMDVARAGVLGSSAWLGFTAAVFAGGSLSDFFPRQRILMLACMMIGLGALFFGMGQAFGLSCLLVGVIGAGTGMIVSSSSALVMELYPQKTGMIINIHHFFYAIGAITGPLSMGYVLKQGWHWQWVYRFGGIGMLLLSGSFLFQRGRSRRERSTLGNRSLFLLLREKNMVLLILISVFGVGVQSSLYLWLVSFLKEARSFPIFLAGLGLSLFSLGVAIGRLLSGTLMAKVKHTRVLFVLLVLLNLILFLFVYAFDDRFVLVLCLLAGLACSGLFPGVLALGGINFPRWVGTTMGILGTAVGIGSSLISWLISLVSQEAGLRTGFFVTFLVAFVALTVVGVFYKRLMNSEIRKEGV
ncbi:MAG: MFS transporter [Deltaproteobacteria bacterium]|nr:MAG: MFS transporter [Deltaproteobacteria bacterium]